MGQVKVKPMYSKVKVLPHTVYLQSSHGFREERMLEELNDYHEEIEPVFNRTGEYLLGDKCWFEVRGRAFRKRKEMFLFDLRQYDMEDVSRDAVIKLIALQKLYPSLLSKEQNKLIVDYKHFLGIRIMRRKGRKNLKELKAKLLLIKAKANEVPKV